MKTCLQCSQEFEGLKGLCEACLGDDQMLAAAGQNQKGRPSAVQFQSQISGISRSMKMTGGAIMTLIAMFLGLIAPNGLIFIIAATLGFGGIGLLLNGLNSKH